MTATALPLDLAFAQATVAGRRVVDDPARDEWSVAFRTGRIDRRANAPLRIGPDSRQPDHVQAAYFMGYFTRSDR